MDNDELLEVGEIMSALVSTGETTEARMTDDEREAYNFYQNQ